MTTIARRRSHRLSVWALILGLSVGWLAVARAATPDGIATILKAIDAPSPQNFRAAQEIWSAAGSAGQANVLAVYAMALANIQNHHVEDASKLLDGLTPKQQELSTIRRARLWLAVLLKHTEQIDAQLLPLIDQLHASAATEGPSPDNRDTAAFLGRLLAYLKEIGINSARLQPAHVRDLQAKFEAGLPDDLRTVAADHARAVTNQAQDQLDKFDAQKTAWESGLQADIDRVNQQIADKQAAIDKAKATAQQTQATYDAAFKPLEARYTQLTQFVASLSAEITRIRNLREPSKPKEDDKTGRVAPGADSKYRSDLDEYDRQRAKLPGLERQFDQARREGVAIETQVASQYKAATEAAKDLKARQEEVGPFEDKVAKLQAELKKGVGWQKPAENSRFHALATYDVFSVPREAQRITAAYSH